MTPRYQHAEAYCLMTYRADDGTEEERVWNSRDGVTPFLITLRSGKVASHTDWRGDVCVPDHVPAPGSRMFVDLTPERADELALAAARRFFAEDSHTGRMARAEYHSPEDLAVTLRANYLQRPGEPVLVEVAG